jgi:oligoendopeptidase F
LIAKSSPATLQYPTTPVQLILWTWPDIEPHYLRLTGGSLDAASLPAWLAEWSRLSELVDEQYNRLLIATNVNTADARGEERFNAFLAEIYPRWKDAENTLKHKLLESGLSLPGFEIPLRNMRAEAELFRAENLPLQAEEQTLGNAYNKIVGAQSVTWQGEQVTVNQLQPCLSDPDRAVREAAWRLSSVRWLEDREAINALWQKLLDLRLHITRNAGFADYRAYVWRQMQRFDYTPADAQRFHAAIEQAVVPVATRIYQKRRERLGVATLRPWDTQVDAFGRPALRPYRRVSTLQRRVAGIFARIDPILGERIQRMIREGLLDLDNRPNKAPGGFCTTLSAARVPFIFMNAVGLQDDVQTLLHEGGHAMHAFESAALPYFQQQAVPSEFAEVASMGMELLAGPYLAKKQGGFYTGVEAARARAEHLEEIILFWPYMAVVDAFQHWVYEHPREAADPSRCDAAWTALWARFMPGVDWSGFEAELATGWHRKLHIHVAPFYYIEYGLAQLGAAQVWANSLQDYPGAIAAYRHALALGGSATLPDLYTAAGAKLAFDAETLSRSVALIETTLAQLEG